MVLLVWEPPQSDRNHWLYRWRGKALVSASHSEITLYLRECSAQQQLDFCTASLFCTARTSTHTAVWTQPTSADECGPQLMCHITCSSGRTSPSQTVSIMYELSTKVRIGPAACTGPRSYVVALLGQLSHRKTGFESSIYRVLYQQKRSDGADGKQTSDEETVILQLPIDRGLPRISFTPYVLPLSLAQAGIRSASVMLRSLIKGVQCVHARQYLQEVSHATRQMHAIHANVSFARLRTPQSLQPKLARRSNSSLRPSSVVRWSFQDDFDASLISRRATSSLPKLKSSQVESSSTGGQSSRDVLETTNSASGSVDDDEIQAHKKAAVQQAFLNGTLGFGFSAGGLVFPYYVGLVSSLVQQGVLQRPAQLAGSSAGSLIAASFNAGLDMETVEKSMIDFGEDCLKNGTRYRLGPLLREFLERYLPQNAHTLCSGTTYVAVTRLVPWWRTQMISEFHSREDLISALLTSCHIPWYFDGRWMGKFRGHFCVDGGVMAFIPTVPDAEYTVKVLCFPSSHLNLIKNTTKGSRRLKAVYDVVDIDITMDSFEEWPYDLAQILKWALVASAQESSSLLIEKGKRDATLWVEAMELAPLVEQKKQQKNADKLRQQQQQEEVVRLGDEAQQDSAAEGEDTAQDWSDHKTDQQREGEADRAQDMAVEAEEVAETSNNNDEESNVEDVAEAAGVDEQTAKHAADTAHIAEQPKKRQKVGEAATTAAAAAKHVGEGVKGAAKAVVGGRESGDGDHNGRS